MYMKFNAVGMDPDLAANYAVHLIDKATTPKERVAVLLQNTGIPNTAASNTPKMLASRKLADIFVGELLGLAMVGMFYNWVGERSSKTYQVVIGVEDALKNNAEAVLSDGAIWDNQNKKKMLFQQVMAQGYYPESVVDSSMIAGAISKKVAVRYRYPENCGLIVNVYSQKGNINFKEIAAECDLSSYTIVTLNWYQLPQVDLAITYHLDLERMAKNIPPPSLKVNLERHPIADKWEYNFDDATGSAKQ